MDTIVVIALATILGALALWSRAARFEGHQRWLWGVAPRPLRRKEQGPTWGLLGPGAA